MCDFLDDSGGPAFAREMFALPGRLGWFGKGAPARNKKLEAAQEKLIRAQTLAAQRVVEIPELPELPPAPQDPPPPAQTASDLQNAQDDARRLAGRRRGIQSTMLSASAGLGGRGGSLGGAAQSLLGGGPV